MKKIDTFTLTAKKNGEYLGTLVQRGDSVAKFSSVGAEFRHGEKIYTYGSRTELGYRAPARSGFVDSLVQIFCNLK